MNSLSQVEGQAPLIHIKQQERDFFSANLRKHPQLGSIADYFLRGSSKERFSPENIVSLETELLRLSGSDNMASFLQKVKKDTLVITAVAGAATRWKKSIAEPQNEAIVRDRNINPDAPRCMALVQDYDQPDQMIPIGTYNLRAVHDLGDQVVVYGGGNPEQAMVHRLQLYNELISPMKANVRLYKQKIYPNKEKPSGHGDLLLQIFKDPSMSEIIKGKKYVIANFGGDANSYQTAVLSLLTMYVLDEYGISLGSFIPTTIPTTIPTEQEKDFYPLYTDSNGIPTNSYHPKDDKVKPDGSPSGQTNVGFRLYSMEQLMKVMRPYEEAQARMERGEDIEYPVGELKQDHFDQACMQGLGMNALVAPIAIGEEIIHTPKGVDNLAQFEADMRVVHQKDFEFKKRHNLI